MVNVFVPCAAPASVRLPAPVRGLQLDHGGEIQRDFAARARDDGGVILSARSSRGCLCDLEDWDALGALLAATIADNRAPYVEGLLFWSGDRYALTERTIDPGDPGDPGDLDEPGEPDARRPWAQGEVVIVRPQPPERRRHRRVVRALAAAVGRAVELRWRSGRATHGVLVHFDEESETGALAGRFFAAAEVLEIV